jgi:protein O-GlcNAc transferase
MSEHELWNELGNLYFMSGAYDQAIQAYLRSINLDSNFGRPYSNLALAYVQKGRYDDAVELYRRSIELLADNKEKAISWNRLGHVHRQLKEYRQAVVAYQQADQLDPEISESREEPGVGTEPPLSLQPGEEPPVLERPADRPAEQELERASTSDMAHDPAAPAWIASPPSDDQVHEPVENLEPSRDGDSAGIFSEEAPGISNATIGEWLPIPELAAESANGAWQVQEDQVINIEQDSYYFHPGPAPVDFTSPDADPDVEAADQASRRGETGPAEAQSTALPIGPESGGSSELMDTAPLQAIEYQPPIISRPEYSAEELSRIEVDIARFRRVVQINTRNAFAWDTLGGLYKSAGRYKEAIMAYQQAISIDSGKAFYHYHLGLVYAAEGRNEDAIATFQKVVELDPAFCLAHATLGGYYRKMGLEELAQRHIEKALSDFNVEENEYNHACLQAICGNTERAIELLEIALKNKQTIIDWVRRDPDLDFIRGEPRFQALIASYTPEVEV